MVCIMLIAIAVSMEVGTGNQIRVESCEVLEEEDELRQAS